MPDLPPPLPEPVPIVRTVDAPPANVRPWNTGATPAVSPIPSWSSELKAPVIVTPERESVSRNHTVQFGERLRPTTADDVIKFATKKGLVIEDAKPAWLESCPYVFNRFDTFMKRESDQDGRMNRFGISGEGFYVDPPLKFRNPNYSVENGPALIVTNGIPVEGPMGAAHYCCEFARIYGCRVYFIPNDQPESLLRPGKAPSRLGTVLDGAMNTALLHMDPERGSKLEPAIENLKTVIKHLTREKRKFFIVSHSQGGAHASRALEELQREYRHDEASLRAIDRSLLEVHQWAPATYAAPKRWADCFRVREHRRDWVQLAANITFNFRMDSDDPNEDIVFIPGRGIAGAFDEKSAPLKRMFETFATTIPGSGHGMDGYIVGTPFALLKEAAAKSRNDAEARGEKWNTQWSSWRAANDMHAFMKLGIYSPWIFEHQTAALLSRCRHEKTYPDAVEFSRNMLQLAGKDGRIGEYSIPRDYVNCMKWLYPQR